MFNRKSVVSVVLACATLLFNSAFAETKVIEKTTMPFAQCIASIQRAATTLGVAPDNIVETSALRIVRFPTNDGSGQSLLVTCSKPDQIKLVNLTTP